MMNLEVVNAEQIKGYFNKYAEDRVKVEMTDSNVKELLAQWEKGKSFIKNTIFGGKNYIKFDVETNKVFADDEAELIEIRDGLRNVFAKYDFEYTYPWLEGFTTIIHKKTRSVRRFFIGTEELYSNKTSDDIIIRKGESHRTYAGGSKVFKAIQKMATFLGFSQEDNKRIEGLRDKHSKIMANKKAKATYIASIHPMDFLTLSDNAHGWSSCLSVQDSGCYVGGVLEVLRDEITMVVYRESEREMVTSKGFTWNSKPYRTMVHINEDGIILNKSYPYLNKDVNKAIIDKIMDISPYEYGESLPLSEIHGLSVTFEVCYDDTENCSEYCYGAKAKGANGYVELESYIDGVSDRCPFCGCDTILDEETLCCCDCKIEIPFCCGCGDEDDDLYETPDGLMCSYCAYRYFTRCDRCGELHTKDNVTYVDNCEEWYCSDCSNELGVCYCEECGGYFTEEEMIGDVCNSCATEEEDED